jgi:hypothetical protein
MNRNKKQKVQRTVTIRSGVRNSRILAQLFPENVFKTGAAVGLY